MEKSATVGVVERLGGLYDDDDARLRSSSSKVNGPCPFGTEKNQIIQIWAETIQTKAQTFWRTITALVNLTEGDKIRFLAQMLWPNTYRLDCTALGNPIGPVTRQYSCEACLGLPMEQPVPGTCAPVACAVCVDAVHRLEYEKLHGVGTFPFRALEPDDLIQLIQACHNDGIWTPDKGAYTHDVLVKIRQMGRVLPATTIATTPAAAARCSLPLRSWKQHRWDKSGVLSPKHVAALLDRHGACVGVLWVCPWYHRFDADRDDALVYRGCGRSQAARNHSKQLYGDQVGSHAVVCFGYRFCGDQNQMHVLVLDNHSVTGPRRWVDVEELDTLYTLTVDPFALAWIASLADL